MITFRFRGITRVIDMESQAVFPFIKQPHLDSSIFLPTYVRNGKMNQGGKK